MGNKGSMIMTQLQSMSSSWSAVSHLYKSHRYLKQCHPTPPMQENFAHKLKLVAAFQVLQNNPSPMTILSQGESHGHIIHTWSAASKGVLFVCWYIASELGTVSKPLQALPIGPKKVPVQAWPSKSAAYASQQISNFYRALSGDSSTASAIIVGTWGGH